MPTSPVHHYRIAYRDPSEETRELAHTTSLIEANASAASWMPLFRRQGKTGEVVIVDVTTGETVRVLPVEPSR